MKKLLVILCFAILSSCGEIDQTGNAKSINSKFFVSKLTDLSNDEVISATTLCSDLVTKETALKTRFMTKFFNYESEIKDCESTDPITKDVSLSLESSNGNLRFVVSSDSAYAFLRPELKDEFGVFAKFCDSLEFKQRFAEISENEVSHFEITERNDSFEVDVLFSYLNETIKNKKEFKVYKKESLTYNKDDSVSSPKAMVTSRSVETTAGCDQGKSYTKSSKLKSIRD